MTQEELHHAQQVWWVLQEIKRLLLKKNPNGNNIVYPIYVFHNESAMPTFKQQEEILSELQRKGTIRMNPIPQTGQLIAIGMDEYNITLVQPHFDELYSQLESEYLKKNIKDYDALFEHFDENLKTKIVQILTIIIQKYHLRSATSNLSDNTDELKIPKADFLTNDVSIDDVEKTLLLLSSKIGFSPYFNESKSDIRIAFSPSFSTKNAIELLRKLKQLLVEPKINTEIKAPSLIAKKSVSNDTSWDDITIQFLNGDEVIIKAKDQTHQTNCEVMGFMNKKNKQPNMQWKFLQLLALHGGEFSWEIASKVNLSKNVVESFVKKKQLLSDTLKTYFQISDDPFYPYKKVGKYKIKIHLISEQNSSSEMLSQNVRNTEKDELGISDYWKEESPEVYEKDS